MRPPPLPHSLPPVPSLLTDRLQPPTATASPTSRLSLAQARLPSWLQPPLCLVRTSACLGRTRTSPVPDLHTATPSPPPATPGPPSAQAGSWAALDRERRAPLCSPRHWVPHPVCRWTSMLRLSPTPMVRPSPTEWLMMTWPLQGNNPLAEQRFCHCS